MLRYLACLTLATMFIALAAGMSLAEEPSAIKYIQPNIPPVELPAYQGDRYEAVAPDTLDLQEMAARAVHGLTSCVDPKADYEIYWWVYLYGNRPAMRRDENNVVQLLMQRDLPLMRVMSGTLENKNVEQRWLEVLFHMRGPDDLVYYPLQGRPWIRLKKDASGQYDDVEGDHYCFPFAIGVTLNVLGTYYLATPDPQLKELGERLTDAADKLAVHREDYAFIPKGAYGLGERPDPNSPIPDNWMKTGTMGWIAYGLAQFSRATGYQPALALSGEMNRFVWKHTGIFDADGHWNESKISEWNRVLSRHFAWHGGPLLGMLEYALAANDREMLEFVRKSYEYAKEPGQHMNLLTGFAPEFAGSKGYTGEICGIALMTSIAVKMSVAGVGDYWDDVDRWIRNHLAEGQLTHSEWMDEVARERAELPVDPITHSVDNVAEKALGCFAGWPMTNDFYGYPQEVNPKGTHILMLCCTGEGPAALYRVWENILHYKDGKLRVNLLLNRASPWADVDSYVPYEGRVDVKVKKACELSIRIPEWVKPDETKCKVNGTERSLSWDGRYAIVGKVEPKDVATLTFPIFERTDKVTIQGKDYTLIRKGNDVVHVDPPGRYCPLYQRDKYRENTARTKKVERFVAKQQIQW